MQLHMPNFTNYFIFAAILLYFQDISSTILLFYTPDFNHKVRPRQFGRNLRHKRFLPSFRHVFSKAATQQVYFFVFLTLDGII